MWKIKFGIEKGQYTKWLREKIESWLYEFKYQLFRFSTYWSILKNTVICKAPKIFEKIFEKECSSPWKNKVGADVVCAWNYSEL